MTVVVVVGAVVGAAGPVAATGLDRVRTSAAPSGDLQRSTPGTGDTGGRAASPGWTGAAAMDSPARPQSFQLLSACQRIETSGVYKLSRDVRVNASGTCVVVNASDVLIDGLGHDLVGNGTGTAVGAARANLSNVTVRALGVRNWTVGVALDRVGVPTVEDVDARRVTSGVTVTDAAAPVVRRVSVTTADGGTVGVSARRASRPWLLDILVRTRVTALGARGLDVAETGNGLVQNLTVRNASPQTDAEAPTIGLATSDSRDLTVDGFAVTNYSVGVSAAGVRRWNATGGSIRGTTLATSFAPLVGGRPGVRENASLTDVTVPGVDGTVTVQGRTLPASYVRVDGTNAVGVRTLRTPNVSVARFDGENASLEPAGRIDAPPRPVTLGRLTVGAVGPGTNATITVGYDDTGVNESTVAPYRRDGGGWTRVADRNWTASPENDSVRLTVPAGGTYGVFADEVNRTLTGCTEIEDPGVYELAGDLTTTLPPFERCVLVNASNVTIDGNGHTITSNGTGDIIRSIIAPAGPGLPEPANVTVRNLTVRKARQAVDLGLVRAPTVRNVTAVDVATAIRVYDTTDPVVQDVVARNVTRRGISAGLTEYIDRRPRVADVRVDIRGAATGVSLSQARDTRLENVTVRAPSGDGTAAAATGVSLARNVTVDGLRVDGPGLGVDATFATEFTLRNATIRNGSVAVSATFLRGRGFGSQSGTVETGRIENLTVGRLSGAAVEQGTRTPRAYLRLDGTNDVTVRNLTTPERTYPTVEGRNVTLAPVGATPTPPRPVTVGTANLTRLGAQPTATVTVPYDPARVDRPTVELFEAGSLVWSSVPAGTGTLALGNRTATVQVDAAGTFGVFADPPTVSGCREIGTAGRYEVTADISAGVGPGGACLEVNASDVTVDGNGRRLDGTDVGTAVRTVGATHTNVTVRNLTVRNWTAGLVLDGRRPAVRNVTARAVRAGIGVTGAERPVVTDVRVATVAGPVADTVGVEAGGARRPTLHNVTVRTRATAPGGVGVGLDDADRAAARSLTLIGPVTTTDRVDPVSRNLTVGLDGNRTNGTTLTDVTVDGHAVGLAAARADRLAVRQLDVSNATVGASVAPIDGRSPANRESGTITNSSVERVAGSVAVGGRRLPAAYVRLDGTNDVVGRDLRTPTATLAAFAGENVTLVPVGATPTAPASVPIGRVTLSGRGAGPAANVSFRYDQAAVNESRIAVYRVNDTAGNWSLVPRATVDPGPDTASLTTAGPDTYGAFAAANATANGSLPLGERLFPNGLPASSTGDPPTDVDGDGTLEDMDGDGRFGFTDVIEFVFSLQRGEYASLTTAQVDALDLDDNGRVTFVDVIDLVFELQGN